VDGLGRAFVSDISGVQVFDGNGGYLDTLSGPADVGVVFGMAFDLQNFLRAATNKPEVSRFKVNRP